MPPRYKTDSEQTPTTTDDNIDAPPVNPTPPPAAPSPYGGLDPSGLVDYGGTTSRAERLGSSYQDLIDAYNLSRQTGIGYTNPLVKQLTQAGYKFDSAGNIIGADASKDFTEADFERLNPLLKGQQSRESVMRSKFDKYLSTLATKKTQAFYDENIDPQFTNIRSRLDEMLSNPTFSAEELADLRSEISTNIRSQESSRLRRVGAVLGLSGLDPNSVAGASIVNRTVEESDKALTDQLRRFGLDVLDQERQQQMAELGFSQNLLQQQQRANMLRQQGTLEQGFGLSSELSALLEAINSANTAERLQKDATRKQLYASIPQGIGQLAQGAGGLISGLGGGGGAAVL